MKALFSSLIFVGIILPSFVHAIPFRSPHLIRLSACLKMKASYCHLVNGMLEMECYIETADHCLRLRPDGEYCADMGGMLLQYQEQYRSASCGTLDPTQCQIATRLPRYNLCAEPYLDPLRDYTTDP